MKWHCFPKTLWFLSTTEDQQIRTRGGGFLVRPWAQACGMTPNVGWLSICLRPPLAPPVSGHKTHVQNADLWGAMETGNSKSTRNSKPKPAFPATSFPNHFSPPTCVDHWPDERFVFWRLNVSPLLPVLSFAHALWSAARSWSRVSVFLLTRASCPPVGLLFSGSGPANREVRHWNQGTNLK